MVAVRCWKVSPEDHSHGRGGFNGEFFRVAGVTDAEFPTLVEAEAAIRRRRPTWARSTPENMSGPVYTMPGRSKHLAIFPCY